MFNLLLVFIVCVLQCSEGGTQFRPLPVLLHRKYQPRSLRGWIQIRLQTHTHTHKASKVNLNTPQSAHTQAAVNIQGSYDCESKHGTFHPHVLELKHQNTHVCKRHTHRNSHPLGVLLDSSSSDAREALAWEEETQSCVTFIHIRERERDPHIQ